ncbi:peptidase [Mycolicibacterium brumae]|nr:peptidase [Mycolicibacterium brumae]RWA22446.1 hypothetical protein MBRU_12755 [Mycolicibacterium brumae DSM 44177]UWW08026.1 peptidase [Mycolicibacterium brumae]
MKLRSKTLMAIAGVAMVVLSGCGGMVDGKPTSGLYNPNRVGGMAVTEGPSGVRPNSPPPTGTVEGTDNGDIDKLALLSVNDLEDYWHENYSPVLPGTFTPVSGLQSYDSEVPGDMVCGNDTYEFANAMYCFESRIIAWDRGVLLPVAQKFFGEMAVNGVLAHEYGHALQMMANLINRRTSTLVAEQQADCFAGDYLRWVAEGNSTRFQMSTGEGLNYVLAGLLVLRDPLLTVFDNPDDGHGTALERISAFQLGFTSGVSACAGIDEDEIAKRNGDLPESTKVDVTFGTGGDVEIDEQVLTDLMEVLGVVFSPSDPPKLSTDSSDCPDAEDTPPASYCPSDNTIYVDMAALQELGTPANEANFVLLQGDNSALSVVTSRYALALQHERGMDMRGAEVGLRTACLTGVAQRAMSEELEVPSGRGLYLSAGDIDEAVAGLLSNGLAASDVDGGTVPAGFTRIVAFRSGVVNGDAEDCYTRFDQ